MGVDRRRRDSGPRRAGRALLVVTAVVVSVLAVQAAPAQAAQGPAGTGWQWPLAGPPPVTRGFDPPVERYGRGHRGVDLGAAPGAVVVAAGAGRVSYAGLLAGRGVVVVVHGELRTTYEPVTAEVVVGQQVAAGQPLGRLAAGHAGCAAAACLHWGLRRGEQYLDPLSLVGAGPVRLLPLGAAADPRVPAAGGSASSGLPVVPTPDPEPEPDWALRSAATPSGALALAALLAGLWLLRPRPAPRDPGGAAAGALPPPARVAATAGDDAPPVPPGVVDLGVERDRRRLTG